MQWSGCYDTFQGLGASHGETFKRLVLRDAPLYLAPSNLSLFIYWLAGCLVCVSVKPGVKNVAVRVFPACVIAWLFICVLHLMCFLDRTLPVCACVQQCVCESVWMRNLHFSPHLQYLHHHRSFISLSLVFYVDSALSPATLPPLSIEAVPSQRTLRPTLQLSETFDPAVENAVWFRGVSLTSKIQTLKWFFVRWCDAVMSRVSECTLFFSSLRYHTVIFAFLYFFSPFSLFLPGNSLCS